MKSYNIKYSFKSSQGKGEQVMTVYATNKEEVNIIMHNAYTGIVKGGTWRIDGVFVKSKQFQKENGNFEYINNYES